MIRSGKGNSALCMNSDHMIVPLVGFHISVYLNIYEYILTNSHWSRNMRAVFFCIFFCIFFFVCVCVCGGGGGGIMTSVAIPWRLTPVNQNTIFINMIFPKWITEKTVEYYEYVYPRYQWNSLRR